MSPPSRRDDPTNPFARHNPWGAPGPGVMRVGPPPSAAPPKPPRPAAVQRPITAPARGARGGVLTGSALPLPTPRAPAAPPAPKPQPQAPAAPPVSEIAEAPGVPASEVAPEPEAVMPLAAAAERSAASDLKSLLKRRAPVLAGVGYVVLVATSAIFLLPMRPEHDPGPDAAHASTVAASAQPAGDAPASLTGTQAPIRAAVATVTPAPVASTPAAVVETAAPRERRAAMKLAAARPAPDPAREPQAPPPPAPEEVRPVIVAQNATPVVPPPLPERAPTVPPPTQDPDAPMVTRLPEMR